VPASRTILIAGAGIGGLTTAIRLARSKFRVVLVEQAPLLAEVGAGLQLSPNASRILIDLGLAPALAPRIVVPDGLSVRRAQTDAEIVFMPLGAEMEFRYGAPYWVVHRGDLQTALAQAAAQEPDISLRLSTTLEDFVLHAHGVTALLRNKRGIQEERVAALIGADGLWSATRTALGDRTKPQFTGRAAWRATLTAEALPESLRKPRVRLWLSTDAHVVLYPLRGGMLFNLVAILRDRWQTQGWSTPAARDELLRRFPPGECCAALNDLLRLPEQWLKWALFERREGGYRGQGPVTLLGDAAHPMLPFMAQGAGMAIEDAEVLARCLDRAESDDLVPALRRYEAKRAQRVRWVQLAAQDNGRAYHLPGLRAQARDFVLRRLGGRGLRARYDWLYDWQPD
jgi:salicylate hydroxylase